MNRKSEESPQESPGRAERCELQKALDTITSTEFDVDLSVVSGHDHLIRCMLATEAVQKVIELGQEKPEALDQVEAKLDELAGESHDPRYMNPQDTALTALLLAIREADPERAQTAATTVSKATGTHDARKLALNILWNQPEQTVCG